jgi:hypothetical protein
MEGNRKEKFGLGKENSVEHQRQTDHKKRKDLVCGVKPETQAALWVLVGLKMGRNQKKESVYATAGRILDKYTNKELEIYKQKMKEAAGQ